PDGNSLSVAINTPLKPSPTVPGHVIRPRPPTLVHPTHPGVPRCPGAAAPPTDPIRIPPRPELGLYPTPIDSAQPRRPPPSHPPPSEAPSSCLVSSPSRLDCTYFLCSPEVPLLPTSVRTPRTRHDLNILNDNPGPHYPLAPEPIKPRLRLPRNPLVRPLTSSDTHPGSTTSTSGAPRKPSPPPLQPRAPGYKRRTSRPPKASREEGGRNLKKVDWREFEEELGRQLEGIPTERIERREEVEEWLEGVMEVLRRTVEAIVPERQMSTFAKRWWSKELREMRVKTKALGRALDKVIHIEGHQVHEEYR
ncbi:hypothetical protein E4T56_gene950, partial [Termitomyces sp. T112]